MGQSKHLGRVAVVGLGVTGRAVADYLETQKDRVDELVLLEGDDKVDGPFDLIIISPGIAPHTALFKSARNATDDLISEIEFAYRESSNRWVAITGTNGKTTTTALTTHLLNEGGQEAYAVGNIGTTAISQIGGVGPDAILVVEVSSFQLETCRNFSPSVAAILNLTPDHLNWHDTLDEYIDAKCNVLRNLDPGSLVLVDAQNEYFSRIYEQAMLSGALVRAIDVARLDDDPLPPLQIKGVHNIENALFAREIARWFEVDEDAIDAALSSFKPVRHRLQFAGSVKGAHWYNDSKATNPEATLKALRSFEGEDLVLLLGGRNKGNDMHPLATAASQVAHQVVVFGQDQEEIAEAFDDTYRDRVHRTATMRDALLWVYENGEDASIVLLSPACTSFDEFDNFEQRGEVFCAFAAEHLDAE